MRSAYLSQPAPIRTTIHRNNRRAASVDQVAAAEATSIATSARSTMNRRAFVSALADTEAHFLPNDDLLEFNNLNLEDRQEDDDQHSQQRQPLGTYTGALQVPQVRRARNQLQQQSLDSIVSLPATCSALGGPISSSLPEGRRAQQGSCAMLVLDEQQIANQLGEMSNQACSARSYQQQQQPVGGQLAPSGYQTASESAYLSPMDAYYAYPAAGQPAVSQGSQAPAFGPQTHLYDAYSPYAQLDDFGVPAHYNTSQVDYPAAMDSFEQQQQQQQQQQQLQQHLNSHLHHQREPKRQHIFAPGSLVGTDQVHYLDEQALQEPFQDSMLLLPESVVSVNSGEADAPSPLLKHRSQQSVYTPLAARLDSGHASSSGSLVLLGEFGGSHQQQGATGHYYSSSGARSAAVSGANDSPSTNNQTLGPIKIQRLEHAPSDPQPTLYSHVDPDCLDDAEAIPVDNEDELAEPELKVCEWDSCGNTFLSMQEFVKHLEERHVNQEPREKNRYYCLWANCKRNEQEFNARYKLLIHMRVHSGEKPYPCTNPDCKKSFSRLENLKIHVRSHTGEKPYKCNYDTCSKSFTNSSDRIKHHKTHRDPKPYSCSHPGCSKRYTDPSSLRKHLRAHKRLVPLATPQLTLTGPSGCSGSTPVLCPADFDPTVLLESYSFEQNSPCNQSDSGAHLHQRLQAPQQQQQQHHHHLQQQQQHCQLSRSWSAGYPQPAVYPAAAPLVATQVAQPTQQWQAAASGRVWHQHEVLMRSMPASYQPGQPAEQAPVSGNSSVAEDWQAVSPLQPLLAEPNRQGPATLADRSTRR